MNPWQVSLGLSVATVVPTAWFVAGELAVISQYSSLAWELYGYRVLVIGSAFVLVVSWAFYSVAHLFSMSDVGSRIDVLDRAIRDGRIGDADLQDALRREEVGEYMS